LRKKMPRKNDPREKKSRGNKTTKARPSERGRFYFKHVRSVVNDDYKIDKMTYAELRRYHPQVKALEKGARAREKRLRAKKHLSDEDRKELRRVRNFKKKMNRDARRVQLLMARQINYSPFGKIKFQGDGVPEKKIETANLKLLEAAQRVEYSKGSGTKRRTVQREWGGGIDHQRRGVGKKGKVEKKQSVTLTPWHPTHAYTSAHDLEVHTHPRRGEDLEPTREIIHLKWARKRVERLEREASSIQCDDRPSAQDILAAIVDARRGEGPNLIVTPRRNILLTPTDEAIPVPMDNDVKTRERKWNKIERDIRKKINEADDLAWDRSGASTPRSQADADAKLERYQAEREKMISAAIERETGVQVRYFKKGKRIKYRKLRRKRKSQ